MTLYKIVGPRGEVIATLSCQKLESKEGRNTFEIIGLAAQPCGEIKLINRCSIEIVGGVHIPGRK